MPPFGAVLVNMRRLTAHPKQVVHNNRGPAGVLQGRSRHMSRHLSSELNTSFQLTVQGSYFSDFGSNLRVMT